MLENQDFSKNLINKIKEEKLVPKARWRFLLKNSLIWMLGVFSLCLGGAAASLIYYVSRNENGVAYRRAGGGLIQSLFLVLPIFWIICLILFVASVYYYIKHTRKGYKYSNLQITLMVAVVIIFVGAMLSVSRLDAKMEDIMSQKAPYYDTLVNPSVNFWSEPEEGRLMGLIVNKMDDGRYLLVDKAQDEWTVIKTIKIDDELDSGRFVRLIGVKSGDYEFTAQEVLPMGPGRGFLKRPPLPPPGCKLDKTRPCTPHSFKRDEKDLRFNDDKKNNDLKSTSTEFDEN